MECHLCSVLSNQSFKEEYEKRNNNAFFVSQCLVCYAVFELGEYCKDHKEEPHRHIEQKK